MRASASVALALALVASADRARADERPSVQLHYERSRGAEACPDEDELRRAVSARLGYDPFSPAAERRVNVRLTGGAAGITGRLELLDVRGASMGTRDLTSASRDCRELVASLSVAIAVGIDPIRGLRQPGAPAPPAAEANTADDHSADSAKAIPRVEPTSSAESTESGEPAPPSLAVVAPWEFRASGGPLLAAGATPSPGVGFALGVGVRRGVASLNLEGRADVSTSTSAADGGEVSASLLLASLQPCAHYGIVAGCLVGALGALRGEGTSVTDPLKVTRLYAAAGGRFAIELPMSVHVGLRLHADLLATLARITLRLDDRDVWTTPPLSAAFGVAVVGTF